IDRPAAEREAFIARSCPGDDALQRELLQLLAAHESAGHYLESLDAARAEALLAAVDDYDAGEPATIGPYRIVRRLGGGGMGVVYLAHDPRLERPVALKLLRAHLEPAARAGQRLIDEARAASALDHPNIAPVYEVGEAADGRAYIAMAYCEGESL